MKRELPKNIEIFTLDDSFKSTHPQVRKQQIQDAPAALKEEQGWPEKDQSGFNSPIFHNKWSKLKNQDFLEVNSINCYTVRKYL